MINMKYLKTVILENFQSHKYSSIDFSEGLNVILGPSDSGKSAIIRGIKWALYNEPSGDYFIREGEAEASVSLIFSDNTKLTRLRSKSKNSYILYKNNGEEIKFEGFGTSVPEEIVEEIGIKKIRLDSEESNAINIGEQLEGPFLLSEKNSTRAGAIGRLIGVNVIDDALKETLRDIRNTSISKKNTEEGIAKIENELKDYEYLNGLEERLNKVEDLRNLIVEKSNKRETLLKCNIRYIELIKDLNIVQGQLSTLKDIDKIDPIIESLDKKINSFKYFNIKRIVYQKNVSEIEDSSTTLDRLDKLKFVNNHFEKSSSLFKRRDLLLKSKIRYDLTVREERQMKDIYKKLNNLPELEETISSFQEKPVKILALTKLRDRYKLNQNNLRTGNAFIKQFDNLEIVDLKYKEVNKNIDRLSKLKEAYKKINLVKKDYEKEKNTINKLDGDINLKLDNYKDILNEIEICPFCLSHIDNEKIDHIIKHYK